MSAFEDVGAVADLPEGEMLGVELRTRQPVCVYNVGGTIGAVGDLCTHALFHLSQGVLHSDGTIECIWHGARFDCRTGAATRHPAEWPVPVYDVRVENGRILVGPEIPVEEVSS